MGTRKSLVTVSFPEPPLSTLRVFRDVRKAFVSKTSYHHCWVFFVVEFSDPRIVQNRRV